MHRRLVLLALVAVAVMAGTVAVAGALDTGTSDSRGASGDAATGVQGRGTVLATPVLSARRAPETLVRLVAQLRLTADLDAATAGLDQTCLSVEDEGALVYERHPELRLTPASTLKVLTGMAALRRLGPEFRFVTQVRALTPAGPDGVIEGPVWIVGAGDPLLSTQEYAESFRNQPQVYTPMEALADAIVASGVREIRGGVAGDESRFDTVRYLPSWKPNYVTDNEIGPVSALVVNDNFAQYRPRRTIPTQSPPVHAATVLSDLLRARGVVVGQPGAGQVPAESTTIGSVSSPPLAEVVGELLRESDNMTAEVLTKELGRRYAGAGSWSAGTKAIRETLAEAGLAAEEYSALDGSGLEVSDKLSCSLLMDALDLAGREGAVASGFAVAGESGTLSGRFTGTPAEGRLRAKTGSLNNVAGLVGFVDTTAGRDLEFALLANDLPDRITSGRLLQERVGIVLSTYPRAPAAADVAPRPAVGR